MWAAKVTITGHTATGTTDLKVAQAALNQIIGKFELLSDFEKVIKRLFSHYTLPTAKQPTGLGNFYIRMQYLSDRCMDVTASG